MAAFSSDPSLLRTVTWNVAAVNNNPLEYWTTYDAPAYQQLMVDVETLIEQPGDRDVPLSSFFPQAAVDEVLGLCRAEGGAWAEGVDEVAALWASDLGARPFVKGFLKDQALGDKRFMSMPDRFTNTVNTVDPATGGEGSAACRPSVVNNFVGDLSSHAAWWAAWVQFMFKDPLHVRGRKGALLSQTPVAMLSKIPRSKYPALSDAEEAMSVPLQVLCLALFDAVLVYAMNLLSPDGEWLLIKRRLCDALFVKKQSRTIEILCSPRYAACDVIFLQEVAANFVPKLEGSPLGVTHHVCSPATLDASRDQNSVILLSKAKFAACPREVSDAVRALAPGAGIMDGDVLALLAVPLGAEGTPWLVASFHGDTDGVQSVPFLKALHAARAAEQGSARPGLLPLLLGIDANVHEAKTKKQAHFADWVQAYAALGLTSCWEAAPGAPVDPVASRTTFNARTYVQPQLQKAVKLSEFLKGDCNPKDYVVFDPASFALVDGTGAPPAFGASNPARDNTGEGGGTAFAETPIPSLVWPSDHAALFANLRRK